MIPNHLIAPHAGVRWKPQRGWASVAQMLTNLTSRHVYKHVEVVGGAGMDERFRFSQVVFVNNPSGGLACCDTAKGNIYLSGEALEGGPVLVPASNTVHLGLNEWAVPFGSLIPTVMAAYWHEIGHMMTRETVLKAEIDHPKSGVANTILNELVADFLGSKAMESVRTYGAGVQGLTPVVEGLDPRQSMFSRLAHVTGLESIGDQGIADNEYVMIYATQHEQRTGERCEIAAGILGDAIYDRIQSLVGEVKMMCGHPSRIYAAKMEELMTQWCEILDEIAPPDSAQMAALKMSVARAVLEGSGAVSEQKARAQDAVFDQVSEQCETSPDSNVATITERAPTGDDWALRTSLREALVHLNYPDINRTEGWETAPPGRLSGARAMQRDALNQIDPFLGASVSPFRRVDRRMDPMVPLTVGVILDQSGSMAAYSGPVTQLGWALTGAARDIDGRVATAGMSSNGYLIDSSRTFRDDTVRSAPSDGAIENFYRAYEVINREIDLESAPGVKLLIVATDWDLVNSEQAAYAQMTLQRFRNRGGIVMSVVENEERSSIEEFHHNIDHRANFTNIAQGVIDIYASIRMRKESVA